MDNLEWSLERYIKYKNKRREDLSKLSYEEKIKILLKLQKITAPLLQARGIKVKPWEIEW